MSVGAGGDDELQGNVDYTFTRPDGTQLGTQGKFHSSYTLLFYLRTSDSPLCVATRL